MRGGQRFLSDMPFPKLLETRVITSAVDKGRFSLTVPSPAAGCRVFFAADIPGLNTMTRGNGDFPLLAPGVIRYRGEPLGVVAAEDAASLDAFCAAVNIDYRAEKPTLELDAGGAAGESLSFREGQAPRSPAAVIKGEYAVRFREFRFPEPQSAVALREKDLLTVYCATRNPFHVRDNVSLVLGLPPDKLRLVVPDSVEDPGERETLPAVLASLAALIAFKTGRPARVSLDNTIKQLPALIRLESSLNADGTLAGTKAEIFLDSGCCALRTPNLFRRAAYALPGPYQHNGLVLRARALLTDKMPYTRLLNGGAAEACFAIESHVALLARAAGVDPFTFRRANLARAAQAGSGADLPPTAPELVMDEVCRLSDFRRKYAAFEALRQGSGQALRQGSGQALRQGSGQALRQGSGQALRQGSGQAADSDRGKRIDLASPARGIGSALACYGFDFIEENEARERHAVTLTLEKDGTLRILTSALETGQALRRLFTAIAARTLEIDPEDVVIESTDTSLVPDSGPMYETHALTSIGRLIEQACRSLKAKKGRTKKAVSVTRADNSPSSRRTRSRPVYHPADEAALSWCATVIEAEIDPAVYRVTVRGIWSTIECGTVLNRDIAVAQVEREIIRALDAVEESAGSAGHKLRPRRGLPDIRVSFVERPYAHGPLGAKGIGELPGLGVAPAYAAAVSQALGRNVGFYPIQPLLLDELGEGV
jgi:CO/xanthine dehydrogenase Mo-binding subunit